MTPTDSVILLSEGHRSDTLLDLSGWTREMVQASIDNERDFDKVADDQEKYTSATENKEQVPITQTSLLLKIAVTTTATSKQQSSSR